jgi:MFS family permease
MIRRIFNPRQAIRALRFAGFRWFILGRVAGSPTGQMRQVVQGWLVYQMTGSALALGWVSTARALVMVALSPVGGVLSDRFEKRFVMLGARVILAISSFGIAALIWLDVLRPWHIVVSSMLDGMAFSILSPAMQTIVSALVDRDTLLNAVSLASVFEGITAIVGATLAGFLIESTSAGSVYLGMGLLFCLVGYTIFRLPPGQTASTRDSSVAVELLDGLRYLRASPVLVAVVGLSVASFVLAQPYNAFLPAFASAELGLDAAGLGLLTSLMGVGALLMSLTVVALGNTRHKGKFLLGAGIAMGICLLLIVFVPVLAGVYLFVTLQAGFSNLSRVMTRTLLQSHSEASYRGRVTSTVTTLSSLSRLSTLPAGALADRYGVPAVVGVLAALLIAIYMGMGLFVPRLRKLS